MSKPKECKRPRVNPNVNYGLWVIMMCQYRFINCNKYSTLCGTLMVGEAVYTCMLSRHVGNVSIFCSILLCTKTALKIKSI